LAIRELQKQVKDLTDELEHKELYCDSLENDYFKDVKNSKEFKNLAYQKRKLERENKELMDYIARDKKRDNWRNYKRY
jgi:predicted  nucleic acid-binding Zn-ribbon protein